VKINTSTEAVISLAERVFADPSEARDGWSNLDRAVATLHALLTERNEAKSELEAIKRATRIYCAGVVEDFPHLAPITENIIKLVEGCK
jgi:hypothetical protein